MLWGLGLLVALVLVFVAYIQIDGIPRYKAEKVDLKVDVTPERVAQAIEGVAVAASLRVAAVAGPAGSVPGHRYSRESGRF